MIEAIIFDLDGVIIDSEPIHSSVEKILFQELGADISNEEHLSFVGRSSENMWQNIKASYQISYTAEELVKMSDERYLKELEQIKDLQPIEGIRELINELHKKYKIAIASSSSRIIIETVLQKFNLERYFPVIVSGAELTNSKPHPEIFQTAAKLNKIIPENCLVIEDSHNGVVAAKRANMHCIAFANPNSGKQDLVSADFVIDGFETREISKIITNINEKFHK